MLDTQPHEVLPLHGSPRNVAKAHPRRHSLATGCWRPATLLDGLRDLGLFYGRDADEEFIHFYTRTVRGVFLEMVERRGGYEGYGAANAAVHLAAQRNA